MTEPTPDARAEAIRRFAATRHADGDWTPPQDEGENAALDEVAGLWRDLDAIADDPAMLAVRAAARRRLEGQTLEPAGGEGAAEGVPVVAMGLARAAPARRFRFGPLVAVAATLAIVVGLGGSAAYWLRRAPAGPAGPASALARLIDNDRRTPREIRLADGTQVTLDGRTRLRVAEDARGARRVTLDRGRAFFRVTHDPARPFVVRVGDMSVTDIGTRFEVRRDAGGIAVTLVEGKVRIDRGADLALTLAPGSRYTLQDGLGRVEALDAAGRTAWISGMIEADDEALSDVIAEFNRYQDRPFVLRDPAAARAARISGTFRLDDPEGFVAALRMMGYGGLVTQSAAGAKAAGG